MSETPNAAEKEVWSGQRGQSWIDYEVEQDSLLSGAGEVVLAEAAPSVGARVLDIGCGTGALTLLMAEAVGREGHVLATDISEPLLTRAAERAASLEQVSTHLGDAQVTDWPEAGFDFAVSRFGVMFFADPVAAFANIRRALEPGGRVVFAAWALFERNPFWHYPSHIAAERMNHPLSVSKDTPGPMGLSTMSLASERLRGGGFVDVDGREVDIAMPHPGGAAGAADLSVRAGPASRIIKETNANDADIAAIRDALEDAYAQYETADEFSVPAKINLLTARAP